MQVRKAVITAAGRGIRQYPASDTVQKAMLPLVDRDGLTKPLIQIIAEEAFESGIEEICIVTAPGDDAIYRKHFRAYGETLLQHFKGIAWAEEQAGRLGGLEQRLRFAVQPAPEGYGHAVWCARAFVGGEPFLLLLGDHLYVSGEARRCAQQLLDLAAAEECSVFAVQATREHLITRYGTIGGRRVTGKPHVYEVEKVIEKPTPSLAETELQILGLRAGYYLCFFGMHVLTPAIFEILDEHVRNNHRVGGEIQLTPAQNDLAQREKVLALETKGTRYDIGVRYGAQKAQIALALAGVDREVILGDMLELLLQRQLAGQSQEK